MVNNNNTRDKALEKAVTQGPRAIATLLINRGGRDGRVQSYDFAMKAEGWDWILRLRNRRVYRLSDSSGQWKLTEV